MERYWELGVMESCVSWRYTDGVLRILHCVASVASVALPILHYLSTFIRDTFMENSFLSALVKNT